MIGWALGVLRNAVRVFVSKKRIIGFAGAIAIAAIAAVANIDAKELKAAVCDAPTVIFEPVPVPMPDADELELDDE